MIIVEESGATFVAIPRELCGWSGNLPGPGVLWILKCSRKPLRPDEIAAECNRPLEYVEKELSRLKRRGDVEQTRNGRWFSIAE